MYFISIGISIFNSEEYLMDAIKSVLMQTYPYWELILIDDGSRDKSLEIAKSFEKLDKRVRVISDGENRKLPFRLNQIIREAKYDYIARMDADDIMFPNRLEIQINFLIKNQKYDLVSSGLVSINNNNQVMGFRNVRKIYDKFDSVQLDYPILHPGILAKKSWYLRNLYSEHYSRAEDYELWSRAISNGDFNIAIIPNLLMFYREEGNLSLDKILQSYAQVSKIYFKYTGSYSGVLKMQVKKILVNILYVFGGLQKLAHRRNNYLEVYDRSKYQKILNSIVGRGT